MAVESPEEKTQKKSVKEYATRLFQDSSVSIVSSIISTGSSRRKVFRILVFLLFTVGFLYQCIKFLCYMFTYPTIINIEMIRPEEYMAPAYTFCNYNIIKRSVFCATFPDKCTNSDDELCKEHPRYCGGNATTKVPDKDAWKFLKNIGPTLDLVDDVKDFLITGNWETPSGPFLRENREEGFAAPCYALGQRINSEISARYIQKEQNWKFENDDFTIDPEEDEKLFPNSKPGILFTVHNPYEAVNPFEKGTFMKPGFLYRITIQKMCRHKCLGDIVGRCYNCSYVGFLYSKQFTYCTDEAENVGDCPDELLDNSFETCGSECKDDCVRSKFSYDVQETYLTENMLEDDEEDESRKIRVIIYFDDSETVKIGYKPQYQDVETFSYIGGFVGIWLGISLVQIADVFESCFLISRYFCWKGAGVCCKSRKAEGPNDIEAGQNS